MLIYVGTIFWTSQIWLLKLYVELVILFYFWSWFYNAILRTRKLGFCSVKKIARLSRILIFFKWNDKLPWFWQIINFHYYSHRVLSFFSKNSLFSHYLFEIKVSVEKFHNLLIISLYFIKILSTISKKTLYNLSSKSL